MAKILKKEQWSDTIFSMLIDAKDVAKAAKPGQFIILIPKEHGERIPLTIADSDADEGWVQIVFQVVGKSTLELSRMNESEELFSFVGPLGMPSEVEKFDGKVVMVGGGIGIAPIHPIAKKLKEMGNHVISIIGAKTADLLIMEDKLKEASTELLIATDDGSKGKKGFVNLVLEELLATEGDNIKMIWAIGPPIMMKACVESAKKFNAPIIVSLNPIMVDGTGMCGACRVTVGGKTKFACVDGPEFNGAEVDFDELMARQRQYAELERKALELYKSKEGIA
ncbi:sulfide/dihydroorotate dehydrogenase-like FAD/NAD-binding protein [Hippea jasoniae]|uniref:sulfide/dihydroorotate dehydrogenase-like FAD/NAD-binding protein n=1 Tax=Hippea jasoniae TaxID=944479 RepID=UPI00055807CE|nr:sulfide/dihydroorotate dehydrogenase-like FAD/NAD-binding protein [Hippea jasoniae]